MKRITQKDIKQILAALLSSGITLDVQSIQQFISSRYKLSLADHSPYVSTRPNSKYEYWQSQIQKTLFHWSHSGVIVHHPGIASYTF